MTVTAEDRRQVHEACKALEKFTGKRLTYKGLIQ